MPFGSLWLPVIVSAVVIFLASWVIHMLLKYHKADFRPLPSEDAVREALAKANIPPGMYMTPHCDDHSKMKEPAMLDKFNKGPVAVLSVFPKGMPNMGKHLGQWFVFCLFVSFVAGYVARITLHPGDAGMVICRITGTVAFAAYACGHIMDSIWKGQPWGNTGRAILDGIIYAVLTGVTFQFLWPAA